MITELQIQVANKLLETDLLNCVWHSVTLLSDRKGGKKYPVIQNGTAGDSIYKGPSDKVGRLCYIRQSGLVTKAADIFISSEEKSYRMQCLNRIVIFSDNEEADRNLLIKKFLSPVFLPFCSLVSYNTDAYEISKQEVPQQNTDFKFDSATFYMAIDVLFTWTIAAEWCENDCETFENPICL